MHLLTILLVSSILTSSLSRQSCPVPASFVKEKIFQKLPLDDLVVTQDTLAKETVTSDLNCGRRCDRTEGCVMFTFLSSQNGDPGECRMYGQLVTSTMGRENWTGARSYGLKGSPKKCDNGYSMECGRCLRLVNTPMNFTQAMDHCQSLDQGHLVVAKTLNDLTCVTSFAAMNGAPSSCWLWMGGDDFAEKGKFVWHDCTPLPLDSPLWYNTEPHIFYGENCLGTYPNTLHLFDWICQKLEYSLCEKDLDG